MKTKTNLLAAVCLAFCCLTANARQLNCGSHSHSKDENTCHLSSVVEQERVRLRDSILTNISGAKIAEKTLLISRLGAKNDGKTDCRAAFAKAIRKASAMKGAKILVPAGTYYMKGPIVLASNVCIELQKGATLKFAPEEKYFMFNNVDVAKAKIGLSFENASDVTMGSSHIGGKVGTPTTVTPHDNLFGKEK